MANEFPSTVKLILGSPNSDLVSQGSWELTTENHIMEKKLKGHVALRISRAKIVLSLTKDLSRVFLLLNLE